MSFVDAWSGLIPASSVPQDRVFGGNVTAGLGSGVTSSQDTKVRVGKGCSYPRSGSLRTLAFRVADPHGRLEGACSGPRVQSGRVAKDQHHPASSRATATFATTGRRLRRSA